MKNRRQNQSQKRLAIEHKSLADSVVLNLTSGSWNQAKYLEGGWSSQNQLSLSPQTSTSCNQLGNVKASGTEEHCAHILRKFSAETRGMSAQVAQWVSETYRTLGTQKNALLLQGLERVLPTVRPWQVKCVHCRPNEA